MSAGPQVFCCC